MRVETCEKCEEEFELTEINGGGPMKPEYDTIVCPHCGYSTREKTTGYFDTKKLTGPRRKR